MTYGTLMVSSSPAFASAVASCGLDFVFIDTEHVPLDRGELAHMCFAYRALGLPPLVRSTAAAFELQPAICTTPGLTRSSPLTDGQYPRQMRSSPEL